MLAVLLSVLVTQAQLLSRPDRPASRIGTLETFDTIDSRKTLRSQHLARYFRQTSPISSDTLHRFLPFALISSSSFTYTCIHSVIESGGRTWQLRVEGI